MSNLPWHCQVINKLFKKKLRNGGRSIMKLKGIIQICKINWIERRPYGKVNLNSSNNKETLLKEILKMHNVNSSQQLNSYRNLKVKAKIRVKPHIR